MKIRVAIAAVALSLMTASTGQAQLGGLGNVVGDVARSGLGSLTRGRAPISTSIRDATYGDPSKDGFTPRVRAQPLTGLERTAQGGFVLREGYYEMRAQSYCLHAGTHGPGGGDGYLYAPVVGSARDAVISILQNSVAHPEIQQRDIQTLLWAIVARAKFEDLDSRLKLIASQLLTTRQLASLNRNALDVLGSSELSRLTGGAPPFVRQVLTAEGDLRRMMSVGGTSYSDLESVAVLTGAVPRGEGSIDTPSGRCSHHPDGYWIRYIPSGYSQTLVQIWVEPGSTAVGKVYDPAQHIAVPGNTARQRLAQSGRVYGQ